MVSTVPRLERYFTMPYFSLIRFGKWEEVLKEEKPAEDLLYATLMWHYARGMAYANKGKMRKAQKELKLVEKGRENEALQALDKPNFPTIHLSKMATLVLKAEIAGKRNKLGEKVTLLQEAVAIQDGLRYSEPPHFYYPVRQSLGAALLANNQAAEAVIIFKEDLAKFPRNGWSLFGLHQSLVKQNKMEEAKEIETQFEKAWSLADVELTRAVL